MNTQEYAETPYYLTISTPCPICSTSVDKVTLGMKPTPSIFKMRLRCPVCGATLWEGSNFDFPHGQVTKTLREGLNRISANRVVQIGE